MILSHFKKHLFAGVAIFMLSISCSTRQDVVYFQNAQKFETIVNPDTFTPRFKVDDIISIYVSAFDEQSVKPFNLVKGINDEGRVQELDFLIDKDGNIDYPILGKVNLLGLNSDEAKQLMTSKLNDYLKDPIVNIRIKNFRVTVLGEVGRPGTYTIPSERITILEAIGLAGDLEIKGRRDNVLVIRDFDGAKTYTRVDLTTKEVVNSPVFYLTQNDVVYVEPNKSAITSANMDNRTSIIITLFSLAVTSTILVITRN